MEVITGDSGLMMTLRRLIKCVAMVLFLMGVCLAQMAFAQGQGCPSVAPGGLADVAQRVTAAMSSMALLITSCSYVAGLGLAVASIFKFMAHKNNPTQITVGQPIALLFVAAALLYMPSLFSAAGQTLFANPDQGGGVAGTCSIKGN